MKHNLSLPLALFICTVLSATVVSAEPAPDSIYSELPVKEVTTLE